MELSAWVRQQAAKSRHLTGQPRLEQAPVGEPQERRRPLLSGIFTSETKVFVYVAFNL
jgi:hypothetical protein